MLPGSSYVTSVSGDQARSASELETLPGPSRIELRMGESKSPLSRRREEEVVVLERWFPEEEEVFGYREDEVMDTSWVLLFSMT